MSHFRFLLARFLISTSSVATSLTAFSTLNAEVQEGLNGQWACYLAPDITWILSIDGTKISLTIETEQRTMDAWTGRLAFSPTEPEKHFDWKDRRSIAGVWPDEKCLYRCTGDTLLIIRSADARPTQFFSGEGFAPKTLIFIRLRAMTKDQSR